LHFVFFKSFIPSHIAFNDVVILSISGAIGYFAADILIFESFLLIGPRDSLLILVLSPVISALLSIPLHHEILEFFNYLGIFITIAGIGLVISEKNGNNSEKEINKNDRIKGILFAIAGAFGQSIGLVISKFSLNNGVHPVSANILRLTAGLFSISIYFIIKKRFISDFRKMKDIKALGFITMGAIVGPVVGVACSLAAVSMIPIGIASTIMQTSPILLLPVDRIFFKRVLSIRAILGTLIAFTGIAILLLL